MLGLVSINRAMSSRFIRSFHSNSMGKSASPYLETFVLTSSIIASARALKGSLSLHSGPGAATAESTESVERCGWEEPVNKTRRQSNSPYKD